MFMEGFSPVVHGPGTSAQQACEQCQTRRRVTPTTRPARVDTEFLTQTYSIINAVSGKRSLCCFS